MRTFSCTRKTLNAMIVVLESMAMERRQVPVVIEDTEPTCRLWMIPSNKTFKYLANADIETDIEMARLPLTEDDKYGYKFRIDIVEFLNALTNILDKTDETKVEFSLILDDDDVNLTMGPQICLQNLSNGSQIVLDVLLVVYPYDLEKYLNLK